ncbi:oxidative damage protection protein [Marinobacterium rhizophilum]|uniref:Probable Fe(2+)-trafficking protein n=1 Tax=Marinobacterium rhizophilum TaxID=420402 RepID=A0ABY5HFB8_9GAMM|nr:oxidative damage protection protein [Marinobacterium rhizophilum]UTW10664.1 oxidative damage protection protein [Marinobacterium rhizophilum]
MTRTVFCRKYQQELEGLARPPYPGPKGMDIYENISQQAWTEWTAHQTLLINEKHLNMMDPSTREFLQKEMDKFMSGDDYAQAEGYVPPSDAS